MTSSSGLASHATSTAPRHWVRFMESICGTRRWLNANRSLPLSLVCGARARRATVCTSAPQAVQPQQQQVQQQPQQQQQQQPAMGWTMPPPPTMAMPGYPPMYAAPWMAMAPPPMMPPAPPAMAAAPVAPAPAPVAPAAPAAPRPAPAARPAAPSASAGDASAGTAPARAKPLNPGAAATMAAAGKHRKSPEELGEAIERIKQKRRESAQRSRNRRAAYMRELERENKALRDEVARLRAALAAGN